MGAPQRACCHSRRSNRPNGKRGQLSSGWQIRKQAVGPNPRTLNAIFAAGDRKCGKTRIKAHGPALKIAVESRKTSLG